MISFFAKLFGSSLAADLANGLNLAANLRAQVVPEQYCRRLRRRLPEGDWHFTIGQPLFRRIEQVESEHEYAGHSGYIAKPIVVYGWRQHDGRVRVYRLDRSLARGEVEPGSDDDLIQGMRDSEDLRFVAAYRRWSPAHGLFALPGEDPYSRFLARQSARDCDAQR